VEEGRGREGRESRHAEIQSWQAYRRTVGTTNYRIGPHRTSALIQYYTASWVG